MMLIEHEIYTDADTTEKLKIPAKYEVCPRCRGEGTHVNPAIDGHGIGADEFYEDPDFAEAYFSGVYDVRCSECDGERVVKVPDEERCDPAVLEKYYEALREEAHSKAIDEAVRRAECGYRC